MTGFTTRRAGALAAFVLAVAGFAAGVWWFAFTSALDQLEERGRADLSLASDRLTGQLQRFRELAVLLADHPALTPLATGGDGDVAAARAILLEMADKTGSAALFLANAQGRVVATSDGAGGNSVVGLPQFRRALNGALGAHHSADGSTGQRLFSYAAPVFSKAGPAVGAVIVNVDMAGLEWNWPADPSAVFFTDAAGVVFTANRSELLLTARQKGTGGDPAAIYNGLPITPFPGFSAGSVGSHELWSVDGGRYLPVRALHLTRPLPVIGMTAEILLDLSPALSLANLQAAVAAALCLAFGALLFLATERRRVLADRLQIEAAANAELEARVAERTEELSQANAELRREIGERLDAEAALKRAQDDLVQAGKLSALGQMSAGISHELNQPLMAIRSFAENAEMLIGRGKTEVAAENLGRISELARRMGRIIKNLRAFARQESAEMSDVDLAGAVDAALEIVGPRAAQAGVRIVWNRPPGAAMVRGGDVRLQQVVMNLVSNAVDAMEQSPVKRIEIALDPGPDRIRLHVRDTGPGIAEPERIFDPFYSTKEVGRTEGMGLGLSISYGLVQSFGGAIRGRNHGEGGAIFTVELDRAQMDRAA